MNYRKQIVDAYSHDDIVTLKTLYEGMCEQKDKLDKWFDMFIERFSDRMTLEDKTSPVWKKYNERFNEYSELKTQISTAKFFIERRNGNG